MNSSLHNITRFFKDFFSSGTWDSRNENIENLARFILINSICVIGFIFFGGFGIHDIINGIQPLGYIITSIGLIVGLNFIYLRVTKRLIVSSYLNVIVISFAFIYLLITGGSNNTGPLWLYSLPVAALFLLGIRGGTVFTLVFLSLAAIVLFYPGFPWLTATYSNEFKIRFIPTMLGISVVSYALEYIRSLTYNMLLSNIIEKEKAEKEKINLERQLMQAQKMEAIGTMANGFAHNFNNMLASILGYAELVQSEVPKESNAYNDIEEVLVAGYRAKDLVRQVMAVSSQDNSLKKRVKPETLLHETFNSLVDSIPDNVKVDENISSDVCEINVDPYELKRAVKNICMNAIDAMRDEDGVLGVNLERIKLMSENVQDELDTEYDDFIKITISDTGHGITTENMTRIFDPFFTTKDVGEGDGIGLSVAQGIVQKSGGVIKVESEVGKGSEFCVFLPAAEAVLNGDPTAG